MSTAAVQRRALEERKLHTHSTRTSPKEIDQTLIFCVRTATGYTGMKRDSCRNPSMNEARHPISRGSASCPQSVHHGAIHQRLRKLGLGYTVRPLGERRL